MENKLRSNLFRGIKIGLRSFIILYSLSLLLSIVLNFTVVESVKDYLLGNMSGDVGFDFRLIVRIAVFIVNISLFHSAASMKFGFIIFIVLPFVAFSFSIIDNRDEKLADNLFIYFMSSVVFSLCVGATSYFVKGDILGVNIDFVSIRNIAITLVLAFVMQLVITFNRHLESLAGVYLTKVFFKYSAIFMLTVSFVAYVLLTAKYLRNIFLILVSAVVIVPNIAVYLFFSLFGITLSFSDSINKLLATANINLDIMQMPIYVRVVFGLILLILVFAAFYKRKKYIPAKSFVGFTILTWLSGFILALVTYIDLSGFSSLIDIKIYVDVISVAILPLIYLSGYSLAYYITNNSRGDEDIEDEEDEQEYLEDEDEYEYEEEQHEDEKYVEQDDLKQRDEQKSLPKEIVFEPSYKESKSKEHIDSDEHSLNERLSHYQNDAVIDAKYYEKKKQKQDDYKDDDYDYDDYDDEYYDDDEEFGEIRIVDPSLEEKIRSIKNRKIVDFEEEKIEQEVAKKTEKFEEVYEVQEVQEVEQVQKVRRVEATEEIKKIREFEKINEAVKKKLEELKELEEKRNRGIKK